jgi:hypothetical protein
MPWPCGRRAYVIHELPRKIDRKLLTPSKRLEKAPVRRIAGGEEPAGDEDHVACAQPGELIRRIRVRGRNRSLDSYDAHGPSFR